MLTHDTISTACGSASLLLIVILTVTYQRRFELIDLGSFAAAFLAGKNIPAALYLFWYAFSPDVPTATTKLRGYETYVSFAGLSLLLVTCISVWALCRKACDVGLTQPSGPTLGAPPNSGIQPSAGADAAEQTSPPEGARRG